jgi:formylglycine-generating enzyme required for sulfatase activity
MKEGSWRGDYLRSIAQRVSDLFLGGEPPYAAGRDFPWALPEGYVPLLTKRTLSDYEAFGLRKVDPDAATEEEKIFLPVADILNRESHLVLVGEPGSGKTLFANFAALCLAGEGLGHKRCNLSALMIGPSYIRRSDNLHMTWDHNRLLPIYISPHDVFKWRINHPEAEIEEDGSLSLSAEWLDEDLRGFAPHLRQEMIDKGALVIMDSVDEVPQDYWVGVSHIIESLVSRLPRCRFLVTARSSTYGRRKEIQGFTKVELKPFAQDQMAQFIDIWQADPEQARALKTIVEEEPRLSALAECPLYLALLVLVQGAVGDELARTRGELSDQGVEVLLNIPKDLLAHSKDLKTALSRLAFENQRNQPSESESRDLEESTLVETLTAPAPQVSSERITSYLRQDCRLVARRGSDRYQFRHPALQRCLAARYLIAERTPKEIVDLLVAEPHRWWDVILFAKDIVQKQQGYPAWDLVRVICPVAPPPVDGIQNEDCWRALMTSTIFVQLQKQKPQAIPTRIRESILPLSLDWLLTIVTRGLLAPADRDRAGRLLAYLGDTRDLEELVEIPSGTFVMGDDEGDYAAPRHSVYLPSFRIGKYPVTNEQYLKFVQATGREWASEDADRPERANAPAGMVTWHEACAYCQWLTQRWRADGTITPQETVRLPTEAEWEKAARGGVDVAPTSANSPRSYPWGNEWKPDHANSKESHLNDTCVVGMFPKGASPYGCLDMCGQVWEWTISLWGEDMKQPEYRYPYESDDGRNRLDADGNVRRILRGGSFGSGHDHCTVWYRGGLEPTGFWRGDGFRLVVTGEAEGWRREAT